jgi:hypothetical protein
MGLQHISDQMICATYASLTPNVYGGTGLQYQIADSQSDQLGYSATSVVQSGKHYPITSTCPRGRSGSGNDRLQVGAAEKTNEGTIKALHWNSQDGLNDGES